MTLEGVARNVHMAVTLVLIKSSVKMSTADETVTSLEQSVEQTENGTHDKVSTLNVRLIG